MANSPIPDWQLKLKRAQSHFNALRESVEGFVNSDLYGFSLTEPKPGSEQNAWVSRLLLKIAESPPVDDWALMVSDIVHNTRSALDVMAYQFATKPDRGTAFPIHIDRADFQSHGLRAIKRLPANYRALIEREQPYNRWKDDPASDPLAVLADLDNTSKHRLIPAAISWFGADQLVFTRRDVGEIRLHVLGSAQAENGTPLALISFFAIGPDPKVEVKPRKSVNIVFGKGSDRAVGKPVYETIMAIGGRVKSLVSDFEQEP